MFELHQLKAKLILSVGYLKNLKYNLKQILDNHNCLVLVCQILQNTVVIYHPEVSDLKT